MPTFFFDFLQGKSLEEDDVGIHLGDADCAYLEAYAAAADMWSDLLKQRQDPRRCAFQVRDSTGALLFSLPFAELLENCTDSIKYEPLTLARRKLELSAQRAHDLRAALDHELNLTREALREALRLTRVPLDPLK